MAVYGITIAKPVVINFAEIQREQAGVPRDLPINRHRIVATVQLPFHIYRKIAMSAVLNP